MRNGLCECGCGKPTPLAKDTRPARGQIKGQPLRYLHGHAKPRLGSAIESRGDHGAIPLGKTGQFALVDNEDAAWIARHRWWLGRDGYAMRGSGGKTKKMHRLLVGDVPEGHVVDHINRNRLDNRRANLRVIPRSANTQNQRPVGRTSRYRGVFLDRRYGTWIAQVSVKNRQVHIGSFRSEREAAEAARIARQRLLPGAVD